MTQGYNESSTQIFYGLSSDTKPTGCDNGSIFIEMDTKIGYIYDAANADWTEIPNGGGSQVEMDYNEATNKPAINDVTLSGNKTPASLGLQTKINSDSMLDADLVDDTNSDNKFVSATNIVNWNGKANADDVYTKTYMDTALAGKQAVIDDLSDIRSGAALGATSLQPSDVKSTYSSSGTDPVNGKAVAAAIGTLDVAAVGGSGSFISGISETNGKISATAGTVDSTPTERSDGLVTSAGIYTDQARQDTLEAQDRAALVEVVNKGAKNRFLYGDLIGITDNFSNKPLSLPAGEYKIMFVSSASSGAFAIRLKDSEGNSIFYITANNTATTRIYDITITTDAATITVYSSVSNNFTNFMICTKAEWDISHQYEPYALSNAELTTKEQQNENNILSIQQEQITQNQNIAKNASEISDIIRKVYPVYGIRINKNDINPDTRVEYLYDAVGMTPAYMDFNGGSFNYGSWADIWFIKNNRPVALKFDGTVDYELDHTDFTKKLDGTSSDVEDSTYAGNFMSEIPTVYVKRWEDENYNYMAFCEKPYDSNYLAQAHTNANGKVNDFIYLPMFKGWKDGNGNLRSLMGTYPTGSTTGAQEKAAAEANGSGWQLWDKAKIDLIMDLIVLITKSTNCQSKIGVGDVNTYNESDTTNYGKMRSGYETDGATRATDAQFFGTEGDDTNSSTYGKRHCAAFYVQDLWGNRWDRVLGFNLDNNVYKVKMTPPYSLDGDSGYTALSVIPPSQTEGWLKNISSGVYGDVPTAVGASNASGFGDYFYKNASGVRLSRYGGGCTYGLRYGRSWHLRTGSGDALWDLGGSPCFVKP